MTFKLIDVVKKGGEGKIEIPESTRADLPMLMKEMGYTTGAEIGVWKGRYTEQFLTIGLAMFAIDAWLAYEDFNAKHKTLEDLQEEMDGYFKVAQWRINRYKKCSIIRKTSMAAVRDFADDSLDFVYIDGNHMFDYVINDIIQWSKKVRSGGIVSGHDYFNKPDRWNVGVEYAVDAYVQAHNINPLYITGFAGGKDAYKSWFWVKP